MAQLYDLKIGKGKLPFLEAVPHVCETTVEKITTTELLYQMLCELTGFQNKAEEVLYLICVNGALQVIGVFEVVHGSASQCNVTLQAIFTRVLLCGCDSFFLAHNHPNGTMTASKEDCDITHKIIKVCEFMDMNLLDHIIVGPSNEYISMREEGIC